MKFKRTILFFLAIVITMTSVNLGTIAWFTDQVSSDNNKIRSGDLDAALLWNGKEITDKDELFNDILLWEPGVVAYENLTIQNKGDLAFQYQLYPNVLGYNQIAQTGKCLLDVLKFAVVDGHLDENSMREEITKTAEWAGVGSGHAYTSNLLEKNKTKDVTMVIWWEPTDYDNDLNLNNGKTLSAGDFLSIDMGVKLDATQAEFEADSFGKDYDAGAALPELPLNIRQSVAVTVVDGKVAVEATISAGDVQAVIPAGVLVNDGVSSLTLAVTSKAKSDANITLEETEDIAAYDVKIEGVSKDNTVPMAITLGEVAPKYMNRGPLKLYHIEDGEKINMNNNAAGTANSYAYDPATGIVTVYLATFSEVAVVADSVNAWNGEFDYSWYTNAVALADTESGATEYTIANADQLAAFGAIVGGMDGQTEDNFAKKTVKLIADVNLGDKESENNPDVIFYPIGYYNSTGYYTKSSGSSVTSSVSSFSGTFDGNGHTIANFYQNTWEMFGDYNDGYSGTPNYYKDAMGLFGYVKGGTVKNLTVDNFSSDGEFTPTGVIAAYADGDAKFENIAITNCNPRVYNTGNGGIIGIAGSTATDDDSDITLKNITVDNSNKISALWGSWDVACGGLVGMYRGNVDASGSATGDTISFTNCHVSAIIDVYNDVCANYQYYAYRYSGMMIGSVRHNTTNEDGKIIPNMTGISASGCTVNYGDWNDYYYCEFEENTMASYSEDYQFSRVPNSEIDTTNGKEKATCIGHDHTLAEDKQAVYLPFHQLFTGYSWGVSSIGLEKYSGIVTDLDITEGDQEASVEKFAKADTASDNYDTGTSVKISDLFKAKEDARIVNDSVIVAVSKIDPESSAGGIFTKAESGKWEESTVTFTGAGKAKVTIQDYNFCKPTELTITLNAVEKFETNFTGDFLYRVGNKNEVALGSLFAAKDGVEIGTVSVTIEKEAGDANGNYIPDDTWTEDTIKFSGTGVVKVSIKDDSSITKNIYLEVVDAYNVTQYSELKEQDSVLLDNITMSDGGTYRLTGNKVLYGNGFVFDVTAGAHSGVQYDYMSYVIYLENSNLDNVQIVGAVYPEVGGTKDKDYNRAIVMTNGDCRIANSFISNGASPVRNGGNLELINTTLKGGAYANLDLRNGHLILDNVTTINQIGLNDKYNDEKEVAGLGIVVYQEGGTEELKITIRNGLTQYNYLSKNQADTYIENSYGKTVADQMFGGSFNQYLYNDGKTNWANAGIVSMNNYVSENDIIDERSNKGNYFLETKEITLLGSSRNVVVYSFKPDEIKVPSSGYKSAGQYPIEPNVEFDFIEKNYIKKIEGSNDYCYEDAGTVYISMDEGDTFTWDTSILKVTKNGNSLDYEVAMNGTDYTGQKITFDAPGDYDVIYEYNDKYNYSLSDGTVTSYEKGYTISVPIKVAVVEKGAKNAEFSFGASGTAYSSKTVLIGDKTYVMPDVTATVSGKIGSKTVNGTTVYYPITEMYTSDGKTEHSGSWYACFPIFKDAVQIIDYADKGTGDAVTYNQTTVTTVAQIPSTLKATDPKTAFLYSMNATNYPPPTDPTAVSGAVCYTCNRNGLTSSNERSEENTVAEYTYTDNAGKVYYYYIGYHCAKQTSGSCITADTLITLADGTEKMAAELAVGDMVMVFNHITGAYEAAPLIFNTHADEVKEAEYDVLHLQFADGREVKIVESHGFYDMTLMQYVYIDYANYQDFIGHSFYSLTSDGTGAEQVQLVKGYIEKEVTRIFCPVTYFHMNSFANGFLNTPNIPGDITGLVNYFEYDADLKYNEEAMQRDIETYGTYSYDDFKDYISEAAYNSSPAVHLKVAVGKGMITFDEILGVIEYLLAGSLIS